MMSNTGYGYIRIPFETGVPEIEGEELERYVYWLEQALIERVNNLVGDSLRIAVRSRPMQIDWMFDQAVADVYHVDRDEVED